MAQQIASFKSNSGRIHENEHDAIRDDLDHWLTHIGLENTGVRTTFTAAIMADIDNGNHLLAIMSDLKRTAPPKAEAPAIEPPVYSGPVCKGSWKLGTACGKCERCEATRPMDKERSTPGIPVKLRAALNKLDRDGAL